VGSARRTREGDGAGDAVGAGAERRGEADEAAAHRRCADGRRGGERDGGGGGSGSGSGHEGSEGGGGEESGSQRESRL
jgi:hypothetical protein